MTVNFKNLPEVPATETGNRAAINLNFSKLRVLYEILETVNERKYKTYDIGSADLVTHHATYNQVSAHIWILLSHGVRYTCRLQTTTLGLHYMTALHWSIMSNPFIVYKVHPSGTSSALIKTLTMTG